MTKEELLIESVKKNPTSHNIWMLHRCYDASKDKNHEIALDIIHILKKDISISDELKQAIDEFTWEQEKSYE